MFFVNSKTTFNSLPALVSGKELDYLGRSENLAWFSLLSSSTPVTNLRKDRFHRRTFLTKNNVVDITFTFLTAVYMCSLAANFYPSWNLNYWILFACCSSLLSFTFLIQFLVPKLNVLANSAIAIAIIFSLLLIEYGMHYVLNLYDFYHDFLRCIFLFISCFICL